MTKINNSMNKQHADENVAIGTTTANNAKRKNIKTLLKGGFLALFIAAIIACYYTYGVYYPNTDDAYVGSNLLNVSAKVGGYVENIYVENNQFVKKGTVLLEVNPEYYTVALNKAKNDQRYTANQLAISHKSIQVAETNLDKAKNDYYLAKQLAMRYQGLYQTGSGSMQDMQTYTAKAQIAGEQVKQNQTQLEAALIQYKAIGAKVAAANNDIETAKIYMNHTQIIAPVDGYVTNLNLVKGQLIEANEPIFGFIDNSQWWVDANFKETGLSRVKLGQKVTVKLDMYNLDLTSKTGQ